MLHSDDPFTFKGKNVDTLGAWLCHLQLSQRVAIYKGQ